jgi:hypothetical protein
MPKSPVHEIRRGLIKARIWRKKTRFGVRHSVALTRLFKNGSEWKESSRFGRDDLLLAAYVLDKAHTWISQQSQRSEA